ncbi:type IV secretion system protein [Sphingomonas bacterium]|uniref:type IV secretion system protein n=1 Tax=Sphingomonas bacterium TaxID=1895847 RepID=UPI001576CBF2|nr:type IV secretion system protein [Sphingomonas bacterium]
MSAAQPFAAMYGYIASAIDTAVSGFGSGLVAFVAAPLALAATIYFLLLGFAVLRGAIQAPLRELVFQAGKVGFALAAASAVGYSAFVVTVVNRLPEEIIAAGTGTPVTNPGTTFDLYVSDSNKLTKALWAADSKVQSQRTGITDVSLAISKLEYFILTMVGIIVIYVFAAVSGAVGFCIVIFAKLSVAICVALAPLALACLLFNSSRWLFDGWLKQTANYVLLMVIMTIMTRFITGLQVSVMDDVMSGVGNGAEFLAATPAGIALDAGRVLVTVVAVLLIYIVGTIFFFQSPSIAAGIAGGAASGGHGFLQTGANMMTSRLLFRRTAGGGGSPASAARSGGSISRAA